VSLLPRLSNQDPSTWPTTQLDQSIASCFSLWSPNHKHRHCIRFSSFRSFIYLCVHQVSIKTDRRLVHFVYRHRFVESFSILTTTYALAATTEFSVPA
jgi:hypothetical protein